MSKLMYHTKLMSDSVKHEILTVQILKLQKKIMKYQLTICMKLTATKRLFTRFYRKGWPYRARSCMLKSLIHTEKNSLHDRSRELAIDYQRSRLKGMKIFHMQLNLTAFFVRLKKGENLKNTHATRDPFLTIAARKDSKESMKRNQQ